MRTRTGNIVTFCWTVSLGSILSTVPWNGWLGYASTVTLARCPGWILPMSVSSIGVETWTRLRSAILSKVVPPPTLDVADEITWPRDTSISMIVAGDWRLHVGVCKLIRLFSRATSAPTCADFALA